MTPSRSAAVPGDKGWLSLSWLVRLRWGAVAGEVLVIAAAAASAVPLPFGPLLGWTLVTVLSNVAAAVALRRVRGVGRGVSGALLALDILVLTGLLYLTGGAHNPFSILYLVYIALAAVVLGPGWTWALAGLATTSYGALFRFTRPVEAVGHTGHDAFDVHLKGMWLAFGVAAGLIAYFGARLAESLERREHEVLALREEAARVQRLASLATLAAGAAHELGTPLGTIGVAAGEVERAAAALPGGQAITDDARLIRAELQRCRRILEGMAAEAGAPAGEEAAPTALRDLGADVLAELPAAAAGRVALATPDPATVVTVPRRTVARAVTVLVRNALDASAEGAPVSLEAAVGAGRLRVCVEDRGHGMKAEVLALVGEPFFSTKEPGKGLGLGVFLARSVAERLGGALHLESREGRGTRAVFEVPLGAASRGAA